MKLRDLLVLVSGAAAVTHACALSLGNSQGNVLLGSPVDLVFPLRPDPGQTPESSCVTADIWMGDVPLGLGEYSVTPQASGVRVRSTRAVNEPLLTIKLSAGCAERVSRSYTFFADPPGSVAAATKPIDLSTIQPAIRVTPSAGAAQPARANRTATASPRPAAKRPAKVQPKPTEAAKPVAAAVAAEAAPPAPPTPEDVHIPVPAPSSGSAATASAEKPRLRVEPLDDLHALGGVTPPESQAAADSKAEPDAQALLQANAARIEALEGQLLTLQKQLERNLTEMTTLQKQLIESKNKENEIPAWMQVALGLLALSLAVIAWLLQRLRQERQNAQNAWSNTVLAIENSEAETRVDTEQVASPAPAPASSPAAKSPAAPAVMPAMAPAPESAVPTQMPAAQDSAFASEPAPSTVFPLTEVLTAQALFDVQEQAEFYASIGENDQAISILQAHIAEHESSSPLAYVELLQLLYRLGRMEQFEEVRKQFQQHFNVRVPHFLGFARKGRDLWGAYPDVLARVEAAWPTDEVLALLRGLIVRQPGAAETDMRFDLAAFDDLLMLYNVAKTTPASSRGALPGRVRTAPTEVPLPDLSMHEDAEAAAETTPEADPHALDFAAPSADVQLPVEQSSDLTLDLDELEAFTQPAPAAQAPQAPEPASAASELSLNDLGMDMDLLSPTPAQEAAASATAPAAEPPASAASTLSLSPDDALLDGLSLDLTGGASVPSEITAAAPDAMSPEALALEKELQALIAMDERDLPPGVKRKSPPPA